MKFRVAQAYMEHVSSLKFLPEMNVSVVNIVGFPNIGKDRTTSV